MISDINLLFSGTSIRPVRIYPSYVLYPTIFRTSHKTSFFVFDSGTKWLEKGMKNRDGISFDVRGDIIDLLIAKGAASTRTEAYDLLSIFPKQGSLDIIQTAFNSEFVVPFMSEPYGKSSMSIISNERVSDYNLLGRLGCKCASLDLVNQYLTCSLIETGKNVKTLDMVLTYHLQSGGMIAFSPWETRAFGYEDITVYKQGVRPASKVLVFPCILDYIKYQSIYGVDYTVDVIITNHYHFLNRAVHIARNYGWAIFFLRNDNIVENQKRIIKEIMSNSYEICVL